MKHDAAPVSLHPREGPALLLLAFAVVLLIGLLSYRGTTAFGRHANQMEATQRLVTGIDALRSSVTDAETGQRGFLLTGDDRYLAPYRQALADIPVLLTSLGTASIDRPDQAERIRRLTSVVNERLGVLELILELRRSEGLFAALAVIRPDRGKVLMDQVRAICLEIQSAANRSLAQYSALARSNQREGSLISILGGCSLFLLLLVATITIQRG